MKTTRRTIMLSAMLASCAGAAGASVIRNAVTGSVTADNHYALYTRSGDAFTSIGGNELGAAGSPGAYNWSRAESYTFPAGEFIYIAAWSDDRVAQGLIGEFFLSTGHHLVTNSLDWDVFATGVDLDDNAPHPTAAAVAVQVAIADAGNLWTTPGQYMNNSPGTSPWGLIAGISSDANWIWATPPGASNVFIGDGDWDEYLIFRTRVPAPGGAALLAGAGLVALRRSRR